MSLAGIRIVCTFALMGLTVASALAQERPLPWILQNEEYCQPGSRWERSRPPHCS